MSKEQFVHFFSIEHELSNFSGISQIEGIPFFQEKLSEFLREGWLIKQIIPTKQTTYQIGTPLKERAFFATESITQSISASYLIVFERDKSPDLRSKLAHQLTRLKGLQLDMSQDHDMYKLMERVLEGSASEAVFNKMIETLERNYSQEVEM